MSDVKDLIKRAREFVKLADVATPWPWHIDRMSDERYTYRADARLPASAPEMAKLLGEMADELEKVAAGPWQPMETVPKDGTAVLLKFKSGFYQVCYWDEWETAGDQENGDQPEWDSGWVINGDSRAVIMAEPVAWAELLPVGEDEEGKE
jgi:hypothetical protein